VAEVVSSLAFGGAERCALELAARLDPARFETTLLVAGPDASGPLRQAAGSRGVRVRHVPFSSLRDPVGDLRLMRELTGYDVIHVHNRPVDYQTAVVLSGPKIFRRNLKFFWTSHLPYPDEEAAVRRRYQFAAARASRVIACAPSVEDRLKGTLGPEAGKTVTLVNGVDTERFRPAEAAERNTLRQGLGAGEDVILLSAGRLTPQKGFDRLLSAAALLNAHDDIPPWQIWVAGGGPELERLSELVPGLRLEGRVKLLGPRDDVDRLCRAADLFVLLSRYEGLPLALLEALSSGLPAVTSGIPAFSTIDFGGAVKVLDDYTDEIALASDAASVMAGLIANSQERAHRSSLARDAALRSFSLDRWVRQHEELYA